VIRSGGCRGPGNALDDRRTSCNESGH
jgi:hypothetical protein